VLADAPRASATIGNVPTAETDDLRLEGSDVLVVGQRQAWQFVTFAAPTDARSERTLWIDTDFAVVDAAGEEVEGTALARLETLIVLIVREVMVDEGRLVIRFDDGSSLSVSNLPNAPDSQGWWIGRGTEL
jgi:hypothetical protein